ncbi:Alcohol dehydrogenase 1 [Hondaea fermentalgiana]|uniref:Alcohol dehydrogenase 1 n=1 Tax=Hondaea fermentalgiana TaxID=2315210 RepID=A0A2R5GD03_9STRA|nr:Alcohol dehydrogenase 1 [Hondaea fermentalgiana]|eukprot:GBG28862.1 Alcohol dehydrogenase 1 [Hondaea fermentalgiana]
MKAVVYDAWGPPQEALDLDQRFPRAFIEKDSDNVLVKVMAASVSYRDFREVRGDFKSVKSRAMPRILGTEVSGIVEAVGERCWKFRPGDSVIGIVPDGAMAEYVSAPEMHFVRKPKNMSHLHAAAFPMCGLLAFQCLYKYGDLKEGEKVLILNASGGVGSLAVQMAKYKKATVYATASKHVEMVESLGADEVLDYSKCNWWEQLRGYNFDLVLDFGVGYSAWKHSEMVLNPSGGRFVTIVPDTVDGPVEFFNYMVGIPMRSFFAGKRYTYVDGVDLSNYDHFIYISKIVQSGKLRPVLDPDSPFEFTPRGMRAMVDKLATKHTRGKLIINVACSTGQSV